MSTRANIIIKADGEKLYFYRHSDGYPEGTLPTLHKFLGWLKEGRIRNNVSQSAGWLIVLGAAEYDYDYKTHKDRKTPLSSYEPNGEGGYGLDWKVGAYEPTTGLHGDVEYIYEIDLVDQTIETYGAEEHPEFRKEFM